MNPNPVPRVAAIHDLSGMGRVSLTMAIPVLSAMGVQACPVPTAVLSTQTTGFSDFAFEDLSTTVDAILDHWGRLEFRFDGIYSGFLGAPGQVDSVMRAIREFRKPGGIAVVDPVMGDGGRLEPTMDDEMIRRMRELVSKADVITPNLTEAAFLLAEPYDPEPSMQTVGRWLRRLSEFGPRVVVLTSIPEGDRLSVMAYDRQHDRYWKVGAKRLPVSYPGTGDAFASVLTGALLVGDSLPVALDRAVGFVSQAIRTTFGYDIPPREGILVERALPALGAPAANGYELVRPADFGV